MSKNPTEEEKMVFKQREFEKITHLVEEEFQVEEALFENDTPTYYLVWPQETKSAFLRLLKNLEQIELIAFLRKVDQRRLARRSSTAAHSDRHRTRLAGQLGGSGCAGLG